jgi:signal transduction histidine kinase
MAAWHGAGFRTGALGVVGAAALVAAGLTGHGGHDGFLLAMAGGFALGITASLAIADARAGDARRTAEEAVPGVAEPATGGAPALGRSNGHEAIGQETGVAAVARATVAAVAHDMSNPLASLKSNLEWLRDALEAGRLEAREEQAEAREVLRDAREAAERLRVDVGALKAAGRGEPPSASPS